MGLSGEEFVGNPIRPDDQINDDEIVSDDELEADLLAINPLDAPVDPYIIVIGKDFAHFRSILHKIIMMHLNLDDDDSTYDPENDLDQGDFDTDDDYIDDGSEYSESKRPNQALA